VSEKLKTVQEWLEQMESERRLGELTEPPPVPFAEVCQALTKPKDDK
jgi:hypothetical protein